MPYTRYAVALLSSVSFVGLAQAAVAQDAGSKPASVSDVVVTAAPREEVKARKLQEDAINLINVQSAETIAKYPDFNAAEALGRMPGVSISTDTGEGRFVNIRGIDGNLAGATFGGVPLLNTNPGGTYFGGGGRAVEYDTLPTGSIDGIILTKTTLPDHEAEGLGGTVELTPRTASHISRPFLDATLGWGYENERNVTGPFDIDLAGGARFGFINGKLAVEGVNDTSKGGLGWISNPTPFSFVLTASRKDDFRGFNDIEEDYNDPTAGHDYSDIQLRRYNYHRRRFGYGGEFDFRPNEDHAYYFRANVAGYTESVIKNRLTYDFSNYAFTPQLGNPNNYNTFADLTLASTQEQETHRNQVYVLGGQDRFGDLQIDYRASYSRATFAVGYNFGAKFTGPSGVAVTYNNVGNNGDYPILNVTDGTNVNNASLYNLSKKKVTNAQERDYDQEWAYAANFAYAPHLINDSDRVKFGFEVRLRDKEQTEASESYTVGAVNLSTVSTPAITNFYGYLSNGPQVNVNKLYGLANQVPGALGVDFAAKEDIFAGYAQYSAKIDRWSFLAGVRVEATDAHYSAYDDVVGAFVTRPVAYTNAFPTLQARYDFTPSFLLRATVSTGVGRPGFNQNTAATSSNHDTTDPQISAGNPNLQPTTGINYDLSLEYYMPRGGILQFGLFDKEFRNYIVTNYVRKADTDPTTEFYGETVGYTTYSNVSGAYARGAEAAYHQQFYWLAKPFDGVGIDANVTVVDSQIEEYSAAASGTGHAEYGLLPGTSQLTWNLAGFYEAHGFEARISAEYVSKELFSLSGVGGSKALDTIQDSRLTSDFTASYKFHPNWKVYFSAKNLTNAPLRFYVDKPSLPIQREYYEQTFQFGIKAHF